MYPSGMVEAISDDLHQKYIAPLVVGMTTLTWAEAFLEAITRGGMRSPDALGEAYLTLMGGYVVGIEIQKWKQATPANPANDPWVERAQRSGVILWLWWVLYIGIHLCRYKDLAVPMPVSVKAITMGVTLLFIGKRVSRQVRHSKRGIGGSYPNSGLDVAPSDEPPADEQVSAVISGSPNGLTLQELEDALPELSRPTIVRGLRDLLQNKFVIREGKPRTRDARYRSNGK